MLKALASYFFGGIEDEAPEAPLECETREVNDWLVVNLPDQNKDSINLNEDGDDDDDDDTCEIDDEVIRNGTVDGDDTVEVDASDVTEMDSDEDDVLLSLSFLMMPMDAENLPSESSNDQCIFENKILEKSSYKCPPKSFESYLLEQAKMMGDVTRRSVQPNFKTIDLARSRLTYVQIIRKLLPCPPVIKMNDSYLKDVLDVLFPGKHLLQTKRNDIVSEFERKDKANVQVLEITPPPMYSKSYVNHRHPEKLLNYDLLQRIQELEPEQQAGQRSIRKNLTRGQLNRQNKNYMYETSSKKNRRCNRQRNHSGANNNRKC